jgi:hypothetical protein
VNLEKLNVKHRLSEFLVAVSRRRGRIRPHPVSSVVDRFPKPVEMSQKTYVTKFANCPACAKIRTEIV